MNPTPWDVSLPYTSGINIKVPGDGERELSMQQTDDYRSGKPGSEEVRKTLDWHGLFLLDIDLSYDVQALKALKATYREKNKQYNDFVTRTQDNRIASGRQLDDDTLEALIQSSGYGDDGLRGQLKILKGRIQYYEEVLKETESSGEVVEKLDPERTCFGTAPPRQFSSKTQLGMFLKENPQYVEQHNALLAAIQEEELESLKDAS